MKKSMALSITILLTFAILLSIAGSALANENEAITGRDIPSTLSQQSLTNPAELETFLDQLFGEELKEDHIAGAAVSVVKDGKLFFSKGYGYADLENGIPVDPEQTIFSIGSIGKLFTWTAVMQLVEQAR